MVPSVEIIVEQNNATRRHSSDDASAKGEEVKEIQEERGERDVSVSNRLMLLKYIDCRVHLEKCKDNCNTFC